MKNNLLIFIFFFLFKLNFCNLSFAQDQFNFNVTEIEINEKGNIYKGLKRGTISTNEGIFIDADTFKYNKKTNILFAYGNVIIKDIKNDFIILTNDITYLRNEEKIFTNTRSNAVSKNISIDADTFEYNKKSNTLNAKGNVLVEDKIKKFILKSDDLIYFKNSEKFISKYKSEAEGDEITIKAEEFEYNHILNIFNAKGNVVIKDNLKDIILLSENITYLKNKEKIFTQGLTEAFIESDYNFI